MKSGRSMTDESGDIAVRIVERHNYKVFGRELISDNRKLLQTELKKGLSEKGVDVILFTGGTGVSPRDVTVEAVTPFFEKELDGFGEVLRLKSFQRIGPAAILTRATAGLIRGRLILCLPGSPDAVRTALRLFMRDIPHLVFIARG